MPLRLIESSRGHELRAALELGDHLLKEALDPGLVDDRFRGEPTLAAVITGADGADDTRGVAAISPSPRRDGSSLPPWAMQFILTDGAESDLCELVTGVLPDEGIELWVRPEHPVIIEEIGRCWPQAFNCRRLHLMSVDLPVATEPLQTRALDPDDEEDLAAVVRVNNAAFHSHPDQAGMTIESVRKKLTGIGHSARGVRLAEIDGVINGFCWTQIHHQRMIGEISVIGLHPDVHGRGLGAPMTSAGLDWLAHQGLNLAILYVEAANEPAVRSYQRLGFTITHDDVSWMIPGGSGG